MEQDKIDVSRATPVSDSSIETKPTPRRGAPLWLQILLSLVVIAIAVGIAGLFLPTANNMVKRVGISLPLLTASADSSAAPATGTQGQAAGQGRPAGAGGQGGGGYGGGANRTAVVVAIPATTGTVNNQLAAIGDSAAIQSVTVNAVAAGTLVSVDVKSGQVVKAGDKLATLDSDTQQNALDKAKVALSDADSTLARTQSLAQSNAVPTSQLDAAKLADNNAKLALQAAQIALDQRTITTPINGTVGIIQVTPGNQISTQTAITTVEDDSSILVNFWVAEQYSSQMAVGAPVTAVSAGLPGKTFNGKVSAVDNKIDPNSRTLQIQATIPNPDGIIRPGMSFSVTMAFAGETFAAVDPLAIQWSSQGAYVWKVVNNKVQKGMVTIIQRNTDGVLVTGDVKPGDSIVTQGVLQLNDNTPVRLLDTGTPPSSQASQNGQDSGTIRKGPLPGGSAAASGAPSGAGQATDAAAPAAGPASAPDATGAASAPPATPLNSPASAAIAPKPAAPSAAGG